MEEKIPGIDLEFRVGKLSIKVSKKLSQKLKRTNHGYLARMEAYLGLKEGRWADAIIAVVDRDAKKYQDRIVELNEGRDFLLQNGELCAVGMAIEEIEAWLLADEKALRTVLGDNSIQRQSDLEMLPSRDDKSDKIPKGGFAILWNTH